MHSFNTNIGVSKAFSNEGTVVVLTPTNETVQTPFGFLNAYREAMCFAITNNVVVHMRTEGQLTVIKPHLLAAAMIHKELP